MSPPFQKPPPPPPSRPVLPPERPKGGITQEHLRLAQMWLPRIIFGSLFILLVWAAFTAYPILLFWLPWPVAAGWAQHQRGGNVSLGIFAGAVFGPVGLLIANYSGGRLCPHCRSRGADKRATRCPKCGGSLVEGSA